MKVAFKLISLLVAGVIFLIAVDSVVTTRRESDLFESEMKHDAQMFGYAMKDLVADVWKKQGQENALALIADANRDKQRISVRWVWLESKNAVGHHPHVNSDRVKASLVDKQIVSLNSSNESGSEFLYTYLPVDVGQQGNGALELSEPMEHLRRYTRTTIVQTILLGAGLLLSGIVAAVWLGLRLIGRPLKKLSEKIERIGDGDLTNPLLMNRHDEFGKLAGTLNTMCDDLLAARQQLQAESAAKIRAVEELRHADRLRTVGRLSAGVAHELGTPLNVVAEHSRMIQNQCNGNIEVAESAEIIESQSERMTGIIRMLLDFSRRRPAEKKKTDLIKLCEETIQLIRPLAVKRNVNLDFTPSAEPVECNVVEQQIQHVVGNLIDNAIDASQADGNISIQVSRKSVEQSPHPDNASGRYAVIEVRDQGSGISREDIERVFEPFFTTKEIGEGTGLGLSIAFAIVDEHGGWIDVSSKANHETRFSVYLPMAMSVLNDATSASKTNDSKKINDREKV